MEVKRGDRVSLNTLRRIFFFQTAGGISLNSDSQPSAIIPDTATDEHIRQITTAVDNGHLSIGHPEVRAQMPDRKSDIQEIIKLGRNKVAEWVGKMRSDKSISSAEKIRVIEELIELEKASKNRVSVITDAEAALRYIGGISSVVETGKEKLEIKLTSGTE
jgi:hypothetical protein